MLYRQHTKYDDAHGNNNANYKHNNGVNGPRNEQKKKNCVRTEKTHTVAIQWVKLMSTIKLEMVMPINVTNLCSSSSSISIKIIKKNFARVAGAKILTLCV